MIRTKGQFWPSTWPGWIGEISQTGALVRHEALDFWWDRHSRVISALACERPVAAGLAIALWLLFVVIYDLALLGALVADREGVVMTETLFRILLAINPADVYQMFNLGDLAGASQITGMAGIGASARWASVGAALARRYPGSDRRHCADRSVIPAGNTRACDVEPVRLRALRIYSILQAAGARLLVVRSVSLRRVRQIPMACRQRSPCGRPSPAAWAPD